ncbi:MAG: helix-turn-helix domain-containing protein [Acidobacteria bacterium]|nr:MAG: helix-turn-helix domain-containing protein [Acidobacteriota bacterium]
MPRPALPLPISSDQRRVLEAWRDSLRTPRQVALRARIILLATAGASSRAVARALKTTPVTVLLWRKRFIQGGTQALLELAPGRGPRRQISRRKVRQIVEATRRAPPAGEKRWSVRSMARAQRVSQTTVQRIWDAYDLKPHLTGAVRGVRPAPGVVGLYLNLPDKLLVLVLHRRPAPGARMKSASLRRWMEALSELESRVVGDSRWRPRQQAFFTFLRQIERRVSSGPIHLVVDREGTHTQDAAQAWLKRRRFRLHPTPKGATWLDWAARWLGEVGRKRAPRRSSLEAMEQAVQRYLAANPVQPQPFAWLFAQKKSFGKPPDASGI